MPTHFFVSGYEYNHYIPNNMKGQVCGFCMIYAQVRRVASYYISLPLAGVPSNG